MKLWFGVASFLIATSCFAEDSTQEIEFAAGESSSSVSRSVVPGDHDMFTMNLTRAQYVVVSLTSAGQKIVFDLWKPGYLSGFGGQLDGARLASGATEYIDQLPATGRYLIVIEGAPSGKVDYTLTVAVTDPYGVTRRSLATPPATAPRQQP